MAGSSQTTALAVGPIISSLIRRHSTLSAGRAAGCAGSEPDGLFEASPKPLAEMTVERVAPPPNSPHKLGARPDITRSQRNEQWDCPKKRKLRLPLFGGVGKLANIEGDSRCAGDIGASELCRLVRRRRHGLHRGIAAIRRIGAPLAEGSDSG